MRKSMLALLASVVWATCRFCGCRRMMSAAPIRQFIDAFNKGDTAARTLRMRRAYRDYGRVRSSPWCGPHAAQDWAAAYDKHAQATGVTDGR